jgi:hypothetical protein
MPITRNSPPLNYLGGLQTGQGWKPAASAWFVVSNQRRDGAGIRCAMLQEGQWYSSVYVLASQSLSPGGLGPGEELTGPTTSLTTLVTEPTALVAVSVYTVVTLGDTARVPLGLTRPTPWSITTLAALATLQLRTAVPAGDITPGLTEKVATGSGPAGGDGVTGTGITAAAGLTVTVTDFVTAPAALTAVSV